MRCCRILKVVYQIKAKPLVVVLFLDPYLPEINANNPEVPEQEVGTSSLMQYRQQTVFSPHGKWKFLSNFSNSGAVAT